MKKQVVILLALLVLLVALIGGVIYALTREAPQEVSAQTVELLAVEPQQISEITVENASGRLHLTRDGETMRVEGLADVPSAENHIEELLTAVSTLTATQQLEGEVENLADFGLESPSIRAQIVLDDGRAVSFEVGGMAPSGMGRYVRFDGARYLMGEESIAPFERGQSDYISLTVTPFLTQEVTVEQITLQNSFQTDPVVLHHTPAVQPESSDAASSQADPIPASWEMRAPFTQTLDLAQTDRWTQGIFGLAAQSAAALHPDAQAIAAFGLGAPQATLEVRTSDGQTIRLLAAQDAAGGCYLMVEGGSVIYSVMPENIPWLTLTAEVIRGSIFPQTQPAALASVQIESGGEAFMLEGETINGNPLEREVLDGLYTQAFGLLPKQPNGTISPTLGTVATLTFTYADATRPVDRLELVPTGSGDLYMILNGECQYITAESQLTELLTACREATAE